jgi:hypothetical protein
MASKSISDLDNIIGRENRLRTKQGDTFLSPNCFLAFLVLSPCILISQFFHVLASFLGQETMALSFDTRYEELTMA